ncbi:MAG: hypothetical protein L0K86_27325 [Actinomycetia bacterium]|nr:hypothetical protein [Actinomycetes bacterium]
MNELGTENHATHRREGMSLPDLLAVWNGWSRRDVMEQAATRAEADGDSDRAALLRGLVTDERCVSAVEALAAQSEVASRLSGWQWQTVHAARQEGATWAEIGRAAQADPAVVRAEYLATVDAQELAAARHGWSFGMTAEQAREHRAVAGPRIDEPVPYELTAAAHRDLAAAAAEEPHGQRADFEALDRARAAVAALHDLDDDAAQPAACVMDDADADADGLA